ncbi:hypothetical protein NP233_g12305 [Leucocoprinus birnbaumii]|uniref:DUF6589 domain-containing protein n=1 Tax=Leucocoprinus birnbaumii TaxID=56174 RepID=A0AAD5VGI7_9AGAR|nr:hypothetical protein NP233_g12305 [Leucocoprinus birnbaumii]
MQATNQRANMLQTLVGVFLQSCRVHEAARKVLGHLGVSVSVSTINLAMKNLSKEAYQEMQRLAATFETGYAFDNLDFEIKPSSPTEEKTLEGSFLKHISTGSMIPLHPSVKAADLKVSEQMRKLATDPPLPATTIELFSALPPVEFDEKGLTSRDRFNKHVFLSTLVEHGPSFFFEFKKDLGDPEEVELIPLVKTKQVPLRASKTGPSTPAKTGTVMEDFFRQANIGDPNPEKHFTDLSDLPPPLSKPSNLTDVDDHALIMWGDLLTGQHIRSFQDSRIDDETPWLRFQAEVFGPGWLHFRMAGVLAIFRRHILPADAKSDATSLLAYVSQIRPLERHKIETDPNFRQMHEVITHVGIVLRLDAWRVEVKKRYPEIESLEEWAKTKPKWEKICEIAESMIKTYVAPMNYVADYHDKHMDNERDKRFEVTAAYHREFLLYEETVHAMNYGDVGRLDSCLPDWMYLFMGCGKAKYAMELRRYLENMYIHYPKPLVHAIRYSSLCNPTGQKGKWRAIDWLIELNNLYIKRIFGGSGSNHTVDRMVEASPLIEVYKDVRAQFESMFCLDHRTTRHSPPKMKLTFAKLARYMEQHQANEFVKGRDSDFTMHDTLQTGKKKVNSSY